MVILFSNFHLMCVNSAALELAGYDRETNVEGVVKDGDGQPTGELQEMAAMFPIMRRTAIDFRSLSQRDAAIRAYASVANRAGVTTVTDLFSQMEDEDLDSLKRITSDDGFPLRLVPVLGVMGAPPAEVIAQARDMHEHSTDKLRMGAVKLMTDGSIQGWTARVKWPGYVGGQPNGIWNTAPDQISAYCAAFHAAGVQMHIHVNGDQASEVVIDALSEAMQQAPWPGHRHVLQHGQMMGPDQFRRAAELGLAVNLFANHIWYFGDQHVARTIGEDRARRMDATRCALAPEALHAITLGAAHTLKLDAEIGSVETGKRADFAVLAQDPLAVDPAALKDVPVLGTVFGGRVHLV